MNRNDQRRRQETIEIGPIADGVILALWRQGLDTLAIAKHLHAPEWQVANRLPHIRGAMGG